MRAIEYDRIKALEYAEKWAFGRNPAFYDFENNGGDCTNFISQCIFAGSGVMNYTPTFGWYYNSQYSRAPAWTGVQYLYNFLTLNRSVGPYGKQSDEDVCQAGDIIQLIIMSPIQYPLARVEIHVDMFNLTTKDFGAVVIVIH